MTKLGSHKNPAIVRVKHLDRAAEIFALCQEHGWQVVIGMEPDREEDISDIERLLCPEEPHVAHFKRGRNEECFCGSGKKFKKCCIDAV